MYSTILYYFSKDNLYARVEGIDILALYKEGRWTVINSTLEELSNYDEISALDAGYHTLGNLPEFIFEKYGCVFEKTYRELETDTLIIFINDFKEFVVDDYEMNHHNQNKDLKYLASELDDHYYAGYIEFLDDYYDEFIKRKEEFNYVKIIKLDNDYLIEFDKSILDE